MSVTFTCPVCKKAYQVEINGTTVVYFDNNLRIPLKSTNQDCESCKREIALESEKITEEARNRVRARKLGDMQ